MEPVVGFVFFCRKAMGIREEKRKKELGRKEEEGNKR
jgi:hypothetical protein